jgi:hypothetical protein
MQIPGLNCWLTESKFLEWGPWFCTFNNYYTKWAKVANRQNTSRKKL